ncbi:MAG: MATE family efflux transporter [Gammaproteobacteria bacterium]|nr:MATE family efflux transporter [Gammaproteobacteria bacterium]
MDPAQPKQRWQREIRGLMRIAGPLLVNFIAVAAIHFADAVMSGRIGPETMAAVAVGGSLWMVGFTACLGIVMSVSPIVSRRFGAGEFSTIGRYTRQGLILGQLMALIQLALVQLFIEPVLVALGISEEFRELTVGYVKAISWGLPAIAGFLVFRFTTEGIGFTRPIMYISLLSVLTNVAGNYIFMFGKFGVPAMGAVGCGISSAITMWVMLIAIAGYMYRHPRYRPLEIFHMMTRVRLPLIREMLALGVPIAITMLAETGLFSAVSVLMGTRGATVAASHQIALNVTSTIFMIPLALSGAITVRVGHALGAKDAAAARYSGWIGIGIAGTFMFCSAIAVLIFREAVVGIYSPDAAVQAIAINLLFMAAIFQVADGIQISAAGALRGYKDTRVPMVINTFAFWVLAFPLAYMATITYRSPPQYIWGAFVLGLTVSAIMLSLRYRHISGREYLAALAGEPAR